MSKREHRQRRRRTRCVERRVPGRELSGSTACGAIEGLSSAKSLAIGDPGDGRYVLKRLAQYNGFAEECDNKEILDAILLLAQTEGIFTEPAGGVSISVLQKMAEQGKIDANDKVVCYVTGNGLKATESIMEVLQKPTVMNADVGEISAVVN